MVFGPASLHRPADARHGPFPDRSAAARGSNLRFRSLGEVGLGQPARVAVKDVKTGQTRQVPASALSDGSLVTALDGYEYRLFEINPPQGSALP